MEVNGQLHALANSRREIVRGPHSIVGYMSLRVSWDKNSHASAETGNRTTIFRCPLS
jgi:hypothetical protein